MNKTIKVLEKRQKYLKQRIDLGNWGIGREKLSLKKEYKTELNALSTAIQALKALDQAEKELPEKREHEKSCKYWARNHSHDCDCGSEDFNDGIYIAKPIIARLELDVAYWGKQYQKKDIELEGLEEDYKGSKEIWESVTKPLIAQKDLRIEELLKYEWEMRKQLSYLTPQGSEFVEFEECYNYIKEQLREGHEAKKQVVYERRELQSSKQELSQLKGKLSEDSLVKTIQKSIKACGGYEVYDMTDTIRKELGVGDE